METEVQRQTLCWRLEELSDKSLQERLWLGKSEGEMSSFEEAVSGTFNDSGLEDILDSDLPRKRDLITEEIRMKAKELGRLIDSVPRERPEIVIRHPSMERVRIAAAELLAMVRGD